MRNKNLPCAKVLKDKWKTVNRMMLNIEYIKGAYKNELYFPENLESKPNYFLWEIKEKTYVGDEEGIESE